jgi:fibronectin-binding autotransporter adhesin
LCLLAGLLAANSAMGQYFDVNGATSGFGIANNGSYSWDANFWSTSSAGTVATTAWVPGTFARFYGGTSGQAYTVTVNNDESMAGLWQHTSGVTVTINAAGSGDLNITTVGGPVQGFLLSGPIIINAPIVGAGGLDPEFEATGGAISLFGNNSYSGGTALTSGSALVNFNNNNSFGSGAITVSEVSGSFAPLLSTGGSTITLANNFVNSTAGGGVNFGSGANTPVVSTGTWSLGANSINIRNNGDSTAPLTLSGVISGTSAAGVIFSGNNGGKITLGATNTYIGSTTVNFGSAAGTLQFGAANTIASSTNLIMIAGALSLGGFNQNMSATMLSLQAGSGTTAIDFAGANSLSFSNSSLASWTGTLDLADWIAGTTSLEFGTDATGLTGTQLADIEFDNNAATLGSAYLNAEGFVVPEPSSMSLGMLGGLGGLAMLWNVRRRKS